GVIRTSRCPNAMRASADGSPMSCKLPGVERHTDSGIVNCGGLHRSGVWPLYGASRPKLFASEMKSSRLRRSTSSCENAVLHDFAKAKASVAVLPLSHVSRAKFDTHGLAVLAGHEVFFDGSPGQYEFGAGISSLGWRFCLSAVADTITL